jgi:hypothetical protein
MTAAIRSAARDGSAAGHQAASRIEKRRHFRLLYDGDPLDRMINLNSAELIYVAAKAEFGEAAVRIDPYNPDPTEEDFPVRMRDNSIKSSVGLSKTLKQNPVFAVNYVFVDPDKREKAKAWLEKHRRDIIQPVGG